MLMKMILVFYWIDHHMWRTLQVWHSRHTTRIIIPNVSTTMTEPTHSCLHTQDILDASSSESQVPHTHIPVGPHESPQQVSYGLRGSLRSSCGRVPYWGVRDMNREGLTKWRWKAMGTM